MSNANHVTPELVKAARERIKHLLQPGSPISKQAFVPMDQNGAAQPQQPAAAPAPGGAPAPAGGPPPQDPAAGAGGQLPPDAAGGGGAVQISANDLMSFMQQMMAQSQGGQPGAAGAPGGAPSPDGAPKKGGKGGDMAELKQMLTQMLDKLNVLLGWFAGMQGKDPSEAISATGGGPVEPSLLSGTLGAGGAPAAMGQPSEDPGGAAPEVPGLPPGVDPNSIPGGPPPPGMTVQAAMGTRNPPTYKAPVKVASEGLRLHEMIKRLNRP